MAINLTKGQKIDLTKGNKSLKRVCFGTGWDVNRWDGNEAIDLDGSTFLLGKNGKCTRDEDFIFYGQTTHPSGAVEYGGDNRTGVGDGDDETVLVELAKIPSSIEKISFAVTIYDAKNRLQNFGMVENAYIKAYDADTNELLFEYDLDEDFSLETGIIFGELYRRGSDWKFSAIGSGYNGGLAAICSSFGLDAQGE